MTAPGSDPPGADALGEPPPESADPLAAVVAAADPALREAARDEPRPDRVAAGVADPERAFVLEAVREGYLLHYGEARAFAGLDPDLELLGGDTLYALGIARLAAAGDLEGVAELADLISLCTRVHVEGRPEATESLWRASAALLAGRGGGGARAAFDTLAPER